jgi:hypothetical protein
VNLYLVLREFKLFNTGIYCSSLIHHYSNNEWSRDDNDDYFDEVLCYQELLHSEIIDRCKFSNGHIINAQLSSDKSILQEEFTTINGTERQDPTLNGNDLTNI